MHFPKWLKLLCAALAAAWLAWWLNGPWYSGGEDSITPARLDLKNIPLSTDMPAPYLQSTSCAAARCHGGDYDPQRPAWTWAHTLWRADDPHARAYTDLLSARGQVIAARYFIDEPAARAESDQRCLACHLTPHTPPEVALNEGVGCESCHGASREWRNEHYLAEWKSKRAADGFHDLRTAEERARSCVSCHVGGPGQEVNHDLIAAGHPALRFEFGAFHEQLPKHWDADREQKEDPHWEARLWLAGQAASSQAALALSVGRMERGSGVWPELAEYDCESCHHRLATSSWRQTLAAGREETSLKFGRPLWGTWYFSPGMMSATRMDMPGLTSLREQLAQLGPVKQETLLLAKELQQQWQAQPPLTSDADWLALQQVLQDPGSNPADQTFSAAAQRWLAQAALHAGAVHGEAERAANFVKLRELRQQLSQPGEFDPTEK